MPIRLLTELQATIAARSSPQQAERLAAILAEVKRLLEDRPDMQEPLGYREAVRRTADLMLRIYGDQAIEQARLFEQHFARSFARVVTRRLEHMKREAERGDGNA